MASTGFTGAELTALRPQIEAALRPLGETLGIDFEVGSGHYGSTSADLKLKLSRPTADGQPGGEFADNWRALAVAFGLESEWLGREFTTRSGSYTILGLAPRRKLPVVVQRTDGKRFTFAESAVKQLVREQSLRSSDDPLNHQGATCPVHQA